MQTSCNQSLANLGNVLASEVDEARMLVDTAERAKKNADNEVSFMPDYNTRH